MKKQLSTEYLAQVSQEELAVLDGIIDYAERMIREGDLAYRGLRRGAYGKTVLIHREKEGLGVFRVGLESLTYPNASSGYATPHSPVGRLLAVAGHGYTGDSPRWGWYCVTEVRQFRRHGFEELERNVRNFLAMGVDGSDGQGSVRNLRAFVADAQAAASRTLTSEQEPAVEEPVAVAEVDELVPEQSPDTPAEPVVPVLLIVEDDEGEESSRLVVEADDLDEEAGSEVSDRMSLDEHFFLNRTVQQDRIISRSPLGPMWVEGVAGSGKTSAALGRTKMLCDFNTNVVSDRETFRAILGDDFDYWEGEFAGRFSQESSVGFVRTAELIQYLKETCSRLGMPALPVMEYHELRNRLRSYRHLQTSGNDSARLKHSSDAGDPVTTTLAWLNAARLACAAVIAEVLPAQLEGIELESGGRLTLMQSQLLQAARDALAAVVEEVASELRAPLTPERALYQLANRLHARILAMVDRVLGADTLSLHLGDVLVHGKTLSQLARQLAAQPVDLFLSGSQVLVLYSPARQDSEDEVVMAASAGTAASHYGFVAADEQLLSFEEALQQVSEGHQVRALIPALGHSAGYDAVFMPEEELFMRLGQENSLLYLQGNKLRWVNVVKAVGSQVISAQDERPLSLRSAFRKAVRESLFRPLRHFAGIYEKALACPDSFPDAGAAAEVCARLQDRRLTDTDVDLLLCLAHDIASGVSGMLPVVLQEPHFYQSVFIDEVQDFTEQQIYLMTSQADPQFSAITVVGDRSQQLLRNEEIHIAECFPIGQKPAFVALDENLRQRGQPELMRFSTRLRQLFERGADADVQPLEGCLLQDQQGASGAYSLRGFAGCDEESEYLCSVIADIPESQTVAVVLPDQSTAAALHAYCEQQLEGSFRKMSISEHIDLAKKYLVHFTSVLNVKGLEFDVVLLPMLEQYDLSQPVYRNRLYVGCTRARQRLVMSRRRL